MRNLTTRSRASGVQPEQTRQKSRMLETYSRPGMTRSKLWLSSGTDLMPRWAKAFFMIGQATNSVVPGATVVSISTRQWGSILSPMVRIVASRAVISASPRAHVAQFVLAVVALDVHDHAVGQLQAVAVVGGDERLLVLDAAGDHRIDLGVLGLDGRLAAVEHGDLPVAAGTGPLAADDELAGLAGLLVHRVGDDGGHDGPDEADAHDDDDLLALAPGCPGQGLDALEFPCIFLRASAIGNFSPVGLTEYSLMSYSPHKSPLVLGPTLRFDAADDSAPTRPMRLSVAAADFLARLFWPWGICHRYR